MELSAAELHKKTQKKSRDTEKRVCPRANKAPTSLWCAGARQQRHLGAATSVDKVATGLSLTKAVDVLEIVGAIDAEVRQRAYELGSTLAATLMV